MVTFVPALELLVSQAQCICIISLQSNTENCRKVLFQEQNNAKSTRALNSHSCDYEPAFSLSRFELRCLETCRYQIYHVRGLIRLVVILQDYVCCKAVI